MRSPFVFPIGELRHEHAEPKRVEVDESVDWRLDLSKVRDDPPLRAELEMAPMPGGVLVRGSVKVTVHHTCHRCLDEWDQSIEVAIAQLYVTEADEDTDYVIEGPEIDLEPMLRDEVLLALPLTPTCEEGCRGVVDGAESGLNTTTPDDPGDFSSPFAVLKDLLDAGE
jgi:uncharacterized protein